MLNGVVRYFDLRSSTGILTPARGPASSTKKRVAAAPAAKHAAVLPQYGAVTLGVLADPLLRNYIDTKSFALDISGIAAGTGFALLMAIAILPAVYKNAFDPDKPILIQLCALFASGLGWQSLFQAGATAIQ
jgi:hypothetical protein